uniref:Uncharacterized protein n=1 Tax=Arundo donax TaxID=35708 RepID=A0A0A9GH48_ARUDO
MWVLSCRAFVLDHNFKLVEVCTTSERFTIYGEEYKSIMSNQKH